MNQIKNWIGGEFLEPQSKKYFDSYNPAIGEVYQQIPDSNSRDIDTAVLKAQEAFKSWKDTPLEERSQVLRRIGELILENREELARLESVDQGKTYRLAYDIEIPRAAKNFNFFSTAILHHNEESTSIDSVALNYTRREPVGVAALISPWNLPLYLVTWKIAPAIACGNTCVVKPSEMTSATAARLCELMAESGLPAGVCNMVFGRGLSAGDALTKHPQVKLISFTGGTATASAIVENSKVGFKKVSLELGGKNPALIFKDADLDKCVSKTILSSFNNQGEICLCNSRIYVQAEIYSEFLTSFKERADKLVVGNPLDEKTFMGPVVSKEHKEKVLSYIELARSEGATVFQGGVLDQTVRGKGYFIPPTIITDLPSESCLWTEEIFGPVVTVASFDSEKEVIDIANSVPYGLAATIWTRDLARAHRVSHSIDAATIWVNTWMLRDLRVPFGGMKSSGVGREGGQHSIDFYTEQKNICIQMEKEV